MIAVANNSIYEKIENKGRSDAEEILRIGQNKAKQIEDTILKQAQEAVDRALAKAGAKADELLKTKTTEIEQNAKQRSLLHKKDLLKITFQKALERLNSLGDEELKTLVKRLIRAEKIQGDEEIRVNAGDYQRYRKLFGATSGDLLTKLNQELGGSYQLRLGSEPAAIAGGMIIVGSAFDIDLSYETILNSLQEKYETEVAKILFAEGE
jgi:vacuolar-type H+-ATPase subunit E/Vma4